MTTTQRAFGASVRRLEDPRFITGQGRFTDNFTEPGMAYMVVVRSPFAHANIEGVDAGDALKMPGVVGVFTGQEMADAGFGGVPCAWVVPDSDTKTPAYPPVAIDQVRFVGDAVAIVVAETEAEARDASYAVDVTYDTLGVVVNAREATEDGAALVHDDVPS
jgi:carbon-monoxide dehydrogenase large subunit